MIKNYLLYMVSKLKALNFFQKILHDAETKPETI